MSKPPQRLISAPNAIAVLLAINLFNYVDRQVLSAVEPEIQREFFPHDPNASGKTGLLAPAFLVSYMLAAPLLGWLADRMSRWVLVSVSVLLWSLATGASGIAGSFMGLLFARMCVGIGEAGFGPAAPTLISDYVPQGRRGQMLSWLYVAIPVGSALGYVLGTSIKGHFGWRPAFLVAMAPGLLLGFIALFFRDPPRGAADTADSGISPSPGTPGEGKGEGPPALSPAPLLNCSPDLAPAPRPPYNILFRIPSYWLNNAAMAAMTFAVGGIAFWMPAYLEKERGIGSQAGIGLGAALLVGGLLATPLGGWLGDRLRNRVPGSYFLVSGVGMLIGAPLVLLLIWTPFPAAWVVLTAAIFFVFLNTGPSNTALADVTHPALRASAFALNILIVHLFGDALAPPLLGVVHDHAGGWTAVFILMAAIIALSGMLWLIGLRMLDRDVLAMKRALAQA
jgi:MFS transporter, Spinster family, sphingosine-1-phosphate transporter